MCRSRCGKYLLGGSYFGTYAKGHFFIKCGLLQWLPICVLNQYDHNLHIRSSWLAERWEDKRCALMLFWISVENFATAMQLWKATFWDLDASHGACAGRPNWRVPPFLREDMPHHEYPWFPFYTYSRLFRNGGWIGKFRQRVRSSSAKNKKCSVSAIEPSVRFNRRHMAHAETECSYEPKKLNE